ncbi:hypothetical protein BO226_24540 (plasmid) [Rhodococcus sp. 2G]|nr:hypothetical protein BO226_24540 [Rhodococcus sp. 2G]
MFGGCFGVCFGEAPAALVGCGGFVSETCQPFPGRCDLSVEAGELVTIGGGAGWDSGRRHRCLSVSEGS